VNTINDGTGSRYLYSPVPSVVHSENHNSYPTLPALAYVPNNSPIPVMPRAPIPSNLTTPSTMSPLFPPSRDSPVPLPDNDTIESGALGSGGSTSKNGSLAGGNIRYSSSNYSNSIVGNSTSPRSGVSPYFNAPRSSTSTNKGTLGLNGSNERLWLMTRNVAGPNN
jgi:hypothetical protein